MSQQQKAAYFRALKAAGVEFTKHYREYTEAELKTNLDALVEAGAIPASIAQPLPEPSAKEFPPPPAPTAEQRRWDSQPQPEQLPAPVAPANPDEMAGARLNTTPEDEPIRVDPETGFIWYQEEVRKKGYAAPRGRRVLRYNETGTKRVEVQNGEYTESFEVAGEGPIHAGEIKITMPSYQAGIYKDPRFPFKIHVYNDVRGFDFFEVADYYGGSDLVPSTIKRMYVENVLCYDIRTTVQTINAEFRQMQLTGRIRA